MSTFITRIINQRKAKSFANEYAKKDIVAIEKLAKSFADEYELADKIEARATKYMKLKETNVNEALAEIESISSRSSSTSWVDSVSSCESWSKVTLVR